MIYYECDNCGSRLSRFDGGWNSTKCPKCGRMAKFSHMGFSGQAVDFHKPVGNKKPSRGWQSTSSRESRGGRTSRSSSSPISR